jgi:hypothetical protein
MYAKRRVTRTLLLLVGAGALASCGTQSALETSYEIPGYTGAAFRKVAVIGVMRNHHLSRTYETAMAEKLSKAGVQAIPGFTFMGSDTSITQQEMEKRVRGTGADAVLISKVIAVDKTNTYVPPTTYVTMNDPDDYWWKDRYWGYYTPYPFHYWGYWYPAEQVVTSPGYWVTDQTFRVQTTVYRVSDSRLVWTATSDTYDPKNNADLASSLGPILVKKLRKAGLIPANPS